HSTPSLGAGLPRFGQERRRGPGAEVGWSIGARQKYEALSATAMKKFTTVGLGELLWDIFPEGRQLGGAPSNFAYMTSLLGDEGIVASRVGNDELGEEARHRLEHLGLATSFLQRDATYRTGVVQVAVD